MNTYIPHEAKLDSYNKEGELVYTKTNYTGTKRTDEVTWYKNPGENSAVRDSIFVDLEGKKQQRRKVITTTESETGMTTKITDEDGEVLSTDELTKTEDGYCRTVNRLDLITTKEIQHNVVKEFAGTKADVMTLDRVEVDVNSDEPYITATRDKIVRTDRKEDEFEDRAVNGIATDYEYNVHMEFTAYDVDTTTSEIKKGAEPRRVTTEITKTQTNRDKVRLITERIQSSTDLGTYRTKTYSGQSWINKQADNVNRMVITAIATFFHTTYGIDDIKHDDAFDEGYRKIDYDKIKWVQYYVTYQEDMIGVVPQLKSLCLIFVDKDKQAHFKVCGDIVYDMDNNLSHMNVECCYCTYGTELDHAFFEYYQVKPDDNVLDKMKRLAKRTYALARAEKRVAELTARLTAPAAKTMNNADTPEDRILNLLD